MALDLTRTPTPPPSRGGGRRSPAASSTSPKGSGQLETRTEAVGQFLGLIGVAALMLGQKADSQALAIHGPGIATETAELAETQPQIAKVIDLWAAVGPYAGILTATLPLVLQLAVNHGKLPKSLSGQFGVTDPAVLEAQADASMARKAAEMLEEQNRARREAQEQLTRAQQAFAEAQRQTNPDTPEGAHAA